MVFLHLQGCGALPDIGPYKSGSHANVGNDPEADGTVLFRFIDVGQGDATLITTSSGKNILIDAGAEEMGRERVLPAVLNAGGRLELIVASHHDEDHIGGIPEVIKGPDGLAGTADDIAPSMGILDRGDLGSIDTVPLSDYLISASPMIITMHSGDFFSIDGVDLTILYQNGIFADGTTEEIEGDNENAMGISLLISIGGIKYLTSGDLPGPNFPNQFERHDIERHVGELAGPVDILHVSHHGSHNSTSREFLDLITPKYAVISVGENSYGHPSEIVLKNLFEAGTKVYQTDGDICLETDGEGVNIYHSNRGG